MAKVKYGLKNCYYALATIASDGTASYGSPVRLPGAVSLSLEPSGENSVFYADDVAYFTTGGSTGYTGSLELALIPDDFRKACLGETEHDTGILVETSDAAPAPFALLFEFTTDDKALRHVFYNCTASRPTISGKTKGESAEPSTETINLTATSIINAALDGSIVKAKAQSTASAYSSWYTSVYQPVGTST